MEASGYINMVSGIAEFRAIAEGGNYSEKIAALESAMKEHEQLELEAIHHFAHGTYTRELIIPAGTVLTGKIHRHSCINILAKGKMRVATSEGMIDVCAPHTFVSGPGEKKAGVALEDSIWINVHPWTGSEDIEAIERETIVESFEQLEIERKEQLCLG